MRGRLFRFFLFSCAAIVIAGAQPARAGDDRPGHRAVHWRCWYDQAVHVVCLMERLEEASADPAVAGYAPAANLPPVVRALRQRPEAFRRQTVRIPLLSRPLDMAFTAQLARAGVCGSRPACSAQFSSEPPPAAEIARILEWQRDGDGSGTQFARRPADERGGLPTSAAGRIDTAAASE